MGDLSQAAELEAYLHEQIPVSRLMGIGVAECLAGRLVLTAPLEVNHNHLGTAFGGSLATVATLAGYGALWMALGDREAHVVVKKSEINYLHPVRKEIRALCEMPVTNRLAGFRRTFSSRGKARMKLSVIIREDDQDCVVFSGEFVAIRSVPGGGTLA
ncbi:YiiD C-terminal domain-containing protein [Haloferula chungangensis]|uniref:YiiD C-terminal domain-containing protein n=1 Tax=Haloferula chungangensis TaxID=1048331 RepID=A0ABW2L3E1_9BACT